MQNFNELLTAIRDQKLLINGKIEIDTVINNFGSDILDQFKNQIDLFNILVDRYKIEFVTPETEISPDD